ncbi:hypothetical protein [Halanaerobacter jeridensis]|uniref:Heme/copper-type cytochrome/quinol oxidase subunit 2 n=1 Tax=Halanaerobacter jeridensis TaxID=706427 RepID=A0A938XS16_9FIRM|nr:hypothetical protein [Halanaerobacter jeridensis]MBM7556636.1 heme/copper-type cytochrome/quinol oxidase subunit 2 [Halanaerobacter jeridensis]
MNLELIVAGAFMIAVILQSILLLKEFFSGAKKFLIILFSYITSSFIYLSALLIFTANFYNQSKIELIKIKNIHSLTSIKAILWMIIITLATTLFVLIFSFLKKKITGAKHSTSSKYIDQDQAKKLE